MVRNFKSILRKPLEIMRKILDTFTEIIFEKDFHVT